MQDNLQPTAGQYQPPSNQRPNGQDARRYKAILNSEVANSKRTQRAIAAGMGVDPGQLNRWLGNYPDMPGPHQLEGWDREVGPGLVDYIVAQRADVPAGPAHTLSTILGLFERQHGVAMGDFIQAMEDGVITVQERESLLLDVDRLAISLHELRQRLVGGVQ